MKHFCWISTRDYLFSYYSWKLIEQICLDIRVGTNLSSPRSEHRRRIGRFRQLAAHGLHAFKYCQSLGLGQNSVETRARNKECYLKFCCHVSPVPWYLSSGKESEKLTFVKINLFCHQSDSALRLKPVSQRGINKVGWPFSQKKVPDGFNVLFHNTKHIKQ